MNMEFLIKTALSDILTSSLQRAKIYVDGVTDSQKQPFKESFKTELGRIEPAYANTVDDETHVQNIQSFAASLSQQFQDMFRDQHVKIGVAQKGVNLFLKYMWSLDRIPEPPHCPIDAIVLRAIGNDAKWTQLDSVEIYTKIIDECRQTAGTQSLSQWELELWNREA